MMSRLARTPWLVAAGVLLLMVVGGLTLINGDDTDAGNRIVATIPDAQALEKGNEVRASGVLVGRVSSIELVDGKARVELTVDDGVLPIHQDATLTVRPVNVLGEDYVDLDPGSDDQPFMEDAVIPADQVSAAVTLQDVLNTFQSPTAASLAAVVTALGEGVDGNGGEVAAALHALAPAMQHVEQLGNLLGQQNDVLADLVATADPVATAVAGQDGQRLDRLIGSTEQVLRSVAVQGDALQRAIRELPGTLVSARNTLAELDGTAGELTPTLRAIRPITGNMSQVVAELKDFAAAADPALGSLKPVLAEADRLLDQAAPVVAELRATGPDLRRTAASLRPVGRELLDEHLHGVMEFVRKWALSTNGRDGISHYFRGVIYVTPETLESILQSLLPADQNVSNPTQQPADDGSDSSGLPTGPLDNLLGGSVNDLLGGLLGGLGGNGRRSGQAPTRSGDPATDPTSALGLRPSQEQGLLDQLLGGGN